MSRESWRRETFDRLYQADPDPWRFDSSPYEAAKYAVTLQALGDGRFLRGLELGCANGAMTARLAPRCETLVAIDISPAAIALAAAKCSGHGGISFKVASLPDQFDAAAQGSFDLVVISEMLYFLSETDIDRLADAVSAVLETGGCLILVNWTGATDTPCTGDHAAERFISTMERQIRVSIDGQRRDLYRLDRLVRLDS